MIWDYGTDYHTGKPPHDGEYIVYVKSRIQGWFSARDLFINGKWDRYGRNVYGWVEI